MLSWARWYQHRLYHAWFRVREELGGGSSETLCYFPDCDQCRDIARPVHALHPHLPIGLQLGTSPRLSATVSRFGIFLGSSHVRLGTCWSRLRIEIPRDLSFDNILPTPTNLREELDFLERSCFGTSTVVFWCLPSEPDNLHSCILIDPDQKHRTQQCLWSDVTSRLRNLYLRGTKIYVLTTSTHIWRWGQCFLNTHSSARLTMLLGNTNDELFDTFHRLCQLYQSRFTLAQVERQVGSSYFVSGISSTRYDTTFFGF